jgi:hypothetical protein
MRNNSCFSLRHTFSIGLVHGAYVGSRNRRIRPPARRASTSAKKCTGQLSSAT